MKWSKIAIITDDTVVEFYGEWAKSFLRPFSGELAFFCVPHGERSKSRYEVERLQDQLLEKGFVSEGLLPYDYLIRTEVLGAEINFSTSQSFLLFIFRLCRCPTINRNVQSKA